ncbi:hypothetical protein N0V88_006937 [Collariella sp. IMI 366227]|nr:hypothetical protein N0V88_006937 [Collariella sp. IMI 366227]
MPIRVKSRSPQMEGATRTPSPTGIGRQARFGGELQLPDISDNDTFRELVKKLSIYIANVVLLPSTFEQLRTTGAGDGLRHLVDHLARNCTHPAIVNALLGIMAPSLRTGGLNDARANGCEIVAWRFLTHLSEREAVDYCLYEIPDPKDAEGRSPSDEEEAVADEHTALLGQALRGTANSARHVLSQSGNQKRNMLLHSLSRLTMSMTADDDDEDEEDDPTAHFTNLNGLEIAAIADAKRFLSQAVVQKIVTGIWNGDIIFWDTLSVYSVKKPRFYKPSTADPFSRLRVPKYLKSFEVLFFASFLFLYYAVLMERNPTRITTLEIFLCLWFAAFAYDELSEWIDAGSVFYAADVWTLIPCLKEMGKDFIKFMVLVVIVYLGFLTTFSLVGRDAYSLPDMTGFLTRIFFGSSYVGFDIMHNIDPVFGPPLMILFIMLSSILLMGSLTGMLSNSFSRVITHAREEYLYVYSVYVLEASTSNRLTHFYPPFNLLALVIFRPLRLFLPSDTKFRRARILLLKATHLPIVAAIESYEWIRGASARGTTQYNGFRGPKHTAGIAAMSSSVTSASGPYPPAIAKKLADRQRAVNLRQSMASLRADSTQPQTQRVVGLGPEGSGRLDTRQQRAAAEAAEEEAFGEPSTDVEVRIADLAAKIDRLTELVVSLQAQQSRSLTDVSVV